MRPLSTSLWTWLSRILRSLQPQAGNRQRPTSHSSTTTVKAISSWGIMATPRCLCAAAIAVTTVANQAALGPEFTCTDVERSKRQWSKATVRQRSSLRTSWRLHAVRADRVQGVSRKEACAAAQFESHGSGSPGDPHRARHRERLQQGRWRRGICRWSRISISISLSQLLDVFPHRVAAAWPLAATLQWPIAHAPSRGGGSSHVVTADGKARHGPAQQWRCGWRGSWSTSHTRRHTRAREWRWRSIDQHRCSSCC